MRAATPDEEELAKTYLGKWKDDSRPVVVFEIADGNVTREFIGWRSMVNADSMLGRATRACPVYDVFEKKVYFLKILGGL